MNIITTIRTAAVASICIASLALSATAAYAIDDIALPDRCPDGQIVGPQGQCIPGDKVPPPADCPDGQGNGWNDQCAPDELAHPDGTPEDEPNDDPKGGTSGSSSPNGTSLERVATPVGELPYTGAESLLLAGAGMVLLVMGFALHHAGRRSTN